MTVHAEDFFADLENKGEDEVRVNLAQRIYGQEKTLLVYEWLQRKDREREEVIRKENLASMKLSARIARFAAMAAGFSAIAALIALFKP